MYAKDGTTNEPISGVSDEGHVGPHTATAEKTEIDCPRNKTLAGVFFGQEARLMAVFTKTKNPQDLESAINYNLIGISFTPGGHPELPPRFNQLGTAYASRFEHLRDASNLGKAIQYKLQAISLAPDDHPDLHKWTASLGGVYHSPASSTWGDLDDLDTAIKYNRARSLAPHDDPLLRIHLANLGAQYGSRFGRLADIDDLMKAINYGSQAVSLTPDDHPSLPNQLANLGVLYTSRFERLRDVNDIDAAIKYKLQSHALTPSDHPLLPNRLGSLSMSYETRFEHLGDTNDLEKAIDFGLQAVSITPDGDPTLPNQLACLSRAYNSRFNRLGYISDLDKAIEYQLQAHLLAPGSHPNLPFTVDPKDAGNPALYADFAKNLHVNACLRLKILPEELAYIQQHAARLTEYTELIDAQATTNKVLEAMEKYDCIHLARHASQDPNNPTGSGFFLYYDTLNLNTIMRKSFKSKGLAFLSACETAQGDKNLPDGVMHLASGMLMAGYQSAIATMWSVWHQDAPLVADKVYSQLIRGGKMHTKDAAKALYHAVLELSEQVGVENYARRAQFIHIGP
ncbi:hypothetical protein FRC11_010532 [Ceratobasidium sp. 423]|nr:hypothetical protein FRC11_010532 [Ceratobasidium sp. 423]